MINVDDHRILLLTQRKRLGEDAHFVFEEANAIGVADGVGGCSNRGVDAGEYSRSELMRNVVEPWKQSRTAAARAPWTRSAFFMKLTGKPTACILTIAGRTLRALNVFTHTAAQIQPSFSVGENFSGDTPDVAEENTVTVESGDVIIAGTDGLFDNVYPDDIEEVVRLCQEEANEPELVAWKLAKVMRQNSLNENIHTPFESSGYEAGVLHFGGKYADITVVAAFVVRINGDRLLVVDDDRIGWLHNLAVGHGYGIRQLLRPFGNADISC
ncbi:putative protein phosphatase 2C 55 [Primulina tabacum]|uniref:putative protein phosphatase 2C 55 n=1 Tax=Primulina tabacum TaxID=48773 RepID=UPI003F5AA943